MPTYRASADFRRDVDRLTTSQRQRLDRALRSLVADLRDMEAGQRRSFRPGLRVKGVKGAPGVLEMTWAPDGRATFTWGEEQVAGLRHIVWLRCGTHDILDRT